MDSSSSNSPRSASAFESNTHFNIESISRDPDRRSFLNLILYVKPAFHKLLRTKSKVGCIFWMHISEERARAFRTKGSDVSFGEASGRDGAKTRQRRQICCWAISVLRRLISKRST